MNWSSRALLRVTIFSICIGALAHEASAQDSPAPAESQPVAPVTAPVVSVPVEPVSATPTTPSTDEPVLEVTARGHRPPPRRVASDFVLDHRALTAAPHQNAGDLLSSAPGVYVSRPEGDAVAHEIYLRGFDAEHGQDMELSVNGFIPINQVSHLHGQGYADMNFIIPEVVRSVRVTEGVYDPRQGDFAVAGSVDFDLGVAERGYQLRASYGSFDTTRVMLLAAPEGESEDTFVAAQFRQTSGYGKNRASVSGGVLGQYAFDLGRFHGVLHAAAYGGRSELAGVVRADDVAAGRVGFYDSYNTPSANSQSALASRMEISLQLENLSSSGARTTAGVWAYYIDFLSRENFTGYMDRSRVNTLWVGLGDLMEQANQDTGFGGAFTHRTRRYEAAAWAKGDFGTGLTFRTHHIVQNENLIEAPQNEIWDQRVNAQINQTDVGAYVDGDWSFTRFVRVRGGVRTDLLYFDVNDALGNFIPQYAQKSYVVGYRRTALGLAFGPRASVEIKPLPWLHVMGAYGIGYRSPEARTLSEGENAPFARVHSMEAGVRMEPSQNYNVTTALYRTTLSNDVAFDPTQGALEPLGPTTRWGVVVQGTARPLEWLFANLSLTTVHATLDAPPPASASNPTPAFSRGQLLPYVPPVVIRVDAEAKLVLGNLQNDPITGRIGIGFSYLAPRPLPYGETSDALELLDGTVSARWRFVEVGVEGFNLLARKYAASVYSFVSDWRSTSYPSMVPSQHIAAGPPLSVLGTLTLHL